MKLEKLRQLMSDAGICFCDPAAWVAALIPLIPLYIYRMKQAQKRMKG